MDTRAMRRTTLGAVVAIGLSCSFGLHAGEEDNLGKSQQPLVGGALVDAATREAYGLLTLGAGCSASLLRNEWAITAAHCVDSPSMSDPSGFTTNADTSATLTAAWATPQQRQSLRIITFRPLDIAIVRLAQPFLVNGSIRGYNRDVYRGDRNNLPLTVFGRGIMQFASGTKKAVRDGFYRVGQFTSSDSQPDLYTIASSANQWTAGGDSGGPSFTRVAGVDQLVGVHSAAATNCVDGQICGAWPGPRPAPAGYRDWDWVESTSDAVDAPAAAAWDDIDRYLGAFVPEPEPFVGRFGTTPAGYQPIWVYAVNNDGDLIWYRKNSGTAPWQGPKKVGTGWGDSKDIIPAGGNSVYALTTDGKLKWYRHDGFNDGSFTWKGGTEVGNGWTFAKIFSGGDGIVYAIKDDGTLVWYRHNGYADGGVGTWSEAKTVGTGWTGFKDVFSEGNGIVYAIKPDGTLLLYKHDGYATGEFKWQQPRTIGSGWQSFREVVPAGDGVLLAIQEDGKLLWYKHVGRSLLPQPKGMVIADRNVEQWEGPTPIGTGWQGFRQVFALLPATPQGPR